ncbi:MAG: SGNH/GDSL hydrolase family protein [Pseudomonadota bacterium]
MIRAVLLLVLGLAAGCTAPANRGSNAQILVIGDSLMMWNRSSGQSIGDELAIALDRSVVNAAVAGARISNPGVVPPRLEIPAQVIEGDWDWIVMDGGGNDLANECGCDACSTVLDGLISPQGDAGEIPDLVRDLRATGARVMLMGYYGPSGRGGPFDGCRDLLSTLDGRLAELAVMESDVFFADAGNAISSADPSDYDRDDIHPSPSGSAKIAALLAAAMTTAEQ